MSKSIREEIQAEAEKLARAIRAAKETAAKATAEILRPMLVAEWRTLNLDVDAGEWFRSLIREKTSATVRRRADALALLHHVITFILDYRGACRNDRYGDGRMAGDFAVDETVLAGWLAAVRKWENLSPAFMRKVKGGPLNLARLRQAGNALIQKPGRPPKFTKEFCIAIHEAVDIDGIPYERLTQRADCAGILLDDLYEARRRGERLTKAAASQKRRQ